ncbi:MAG: hypothetical protein NW215_02115 [Hyphomicrobiales bacterium]|nr:hypothetical protein [Hyphomicrobiales bacterium]
MNRNRIIRAFAAACALALTPCSALAEEAWSARAGASAGYSSNPQLEPGGREAAFSDLDATVAAGLETADGRFAAAAQVRRRTFIDSDIGSEDSLRAAVLAASPAGAAVMFSALGKLEFSRDEDFRGLDVYEQASIRWRRGAFEPFVSVEARYATLNEKTNIFSGDFLDKSVRSTRLSAAPGVSMSRNVGGASITAGVALGVSTTRFHNEDGVGLMRHNDRAQPSLFASYEAGKARVSASVSHLYGAWEEGFFRDVSRTFAQATASYHFGGVTLEGIVLQAPEETTFALSPLVATTLFEARITFALPSEASLKLYGRDVTASYLGSGLQSMGQAVGAVYTRQVHDGLEASLEASRSFGETIGGETADATAVTLRVSKTLESDGKAALPGFEGAGSAALRRRAAPR